ncbi:serine/threonine-protein kinase [Actinophytocola gossypii]|uniref:serine/threonine-protein kinase n=1 Tax=Actinophytocola gossypii TaxID=2812003 RepID=UPI0021A8037A|nr:serine/threonine-protein kinase [Actinophytocola gossypii]
MSDAVSEVSASETPDEAEMFGPYRVEELLGRGGMGEVHRAYDTVHERYVALKRLPATADEEYRARFRREARIVAGLNAPHVVPIHAHGQIDDRLYLDMRLVDGQDLKQLLADGPLDPLRTNEILTQVAAALDAAHANGVLHRDVKPANILVDADGTAYLADFGIARSVAPDVTKLTQTGEYIGTLDYMAPERLVRGEVDAASDVYSLACVLFQCLTGRVPFPAPDTPSKLTAQLNDPPPAPSLFDRRIPPAMDLVVRTGMDKDPRRRYPSAGELMAAAAAVTADARAAAVVDLPTGGDPGQTYFVRLLATVGGPEPTVPVAGADDADDAVTRPVRERCPYPGLQSFGTGDSEWFFGREQAVRELLARLARQRADSGPLLVVGASGAGKSSLLHAGLLAAHARHSPSAPRLALTPGERPIGTLAARLAALTRADAHHLARQLYHQPATFGELCRAAAARADAPLVIAVDQLEELFTQTTDPREREAFAIALASAWPARVVLAVRADFVEHCITLDPLKPSLAAPYVLGPLTAAELTQVVTKPAEAAGLVLEPGLADRLIADVLSGGSGRDPGALPRLAHALRETWHNRSGNVLTLTGYQATGGVDRAVALTADGVFTRLAEPEQRALRAALLRMVTLLDGGGIARRRAHRAEIPAPLLERLVATRLVTVDGSSVALSHDSLLTAWPRLREWVAEDRQGLLIRQQLDEAAAGWRARGEDRADLYRGARLAAALDWATGRADLTPDEWAFLRASERDRRRTTRRLRGLAVGLASLLVIALVAGFVAVLAREEAERAAAVSLSRQLAAESLEEGDVDPVDAIRKALQGWRTSRTPEARGALLSAPMLSYPAGFATGVNDLSAADVSPDGSLVAVGGLGEVVVWDVEAAEPLDVDVTGAGIVTAVRFSPDGSLLAVSSIDSEGDGTGIRVWEVPDGTLVRQLSEANIALGPIAWRPDGNAIAAPSVRADSTAWVGEWDPRTGNLIRWVADRAQDTTGLAYGVDGDRLAVGHSDGSVELWEPSTGRRISSSYAHRDNSVHDSTPVQVAMTHDLMATASVSDNLIRFWNPRTGAPVREMPDITRHSTDAAQGPTSIAFSADGSLFYTNSDTSTLSVWDPLSGSYLGGLPHGPRAGTSVGRTVLAVAESGDGRTRIAATSDGTVLRWSSRSGWHTEPLGAVTGLDFHPDGGRLTAGDAEGALYTWDVTTGEETGDDGDRVEGGAFAVRYAEDGTRVTASRNAVITVTPPDGEERTIALDGRQFHGLLAVSPDGRWLVAAHREPIISGDTDADHRITAWDLGTGSERAELELGEENPFELAFSPGGDTLLVITGSGGESAANMVTWPVPSFTGDQRHQLGDESLTTAVYTPNGHTLVTAGTGGMLQIRDATTGALRAEFGRHPAVVRQLAISPDGRTLATVTLEDSFIRLWDLRNRELLAVLDGHAASPNHIEFSPDGRRLASAGTDTDVAVWFVEPEDAVERLCANLADAAVDDLDELC